MLTSTDGTHSESQVICCEEHWVREVQIAVDVFYVGIAIRRLGTNKGFQLTVIENDRDTT